MLRNILAVSMVLALAASTQAAIMTSLAIAPTVGVAGMNTYTLTATADPGEKIIGFDFVGGGGTYGIVGPMNQINPFGVLATIFSDNNAAFVGVPADVSADSQFKVLSSTGIAITPSESANSLKAAFSLLPAGVAAATNVWSFVQIATNQPEAVNFRGTLTVRNASGADRLEQIAGALPEPTTLTLLCLGLAGGLGVLRRRS